MDGRLGVRILPNATGARHLAVLTLIRFRVSLSILTQMWARISLAHGLRQWSPLLSRPLQVETGLLVDIFAIGGVFPMEVCSESRKMSYLSRDYKKLGRAFNLKF